ncbi:hypothetical protein IV203_000815 [Nitzschia inconspicua]|uniref:Uncharacterized protein n=1 Tax=Nitzschia inconspicua TaxID=303405 RepID=A0A9K3PSX6_9STRA|nr:hypothetical protein IV203_000815 [Nitzschia inconspicua]
MRFSIAALALFGGFESVESFSSFAFDNNNNQNNFNKASTDPSPSGKKGWDPSPFQETQLETSPVSKSHLDTTIPSSLPFTNDLKVQTQTQEQAQIYIESSQQLPPPVPFAATKAESSSSDDMSPLARPISFTNENKGKEAYAFYAKVSPPSKSGETQSASSAATTLEMSSTATETPPREGTTLKNKSDDPQRIPPPSGDDQDFTLGDDSTVTERMLKKVPTENQAGGAGGSSTLEAFKRAEANWAKLKAFKPFQYDKKLLRWTQDGHGPPPQFVATDGAFGNPKCWEKLKNSIQKELDFDVVICGGTLGIFFAMYLQLHGHNVCVVEAGKLRGREQEWNISMDELLELQELGILTQEDIDAVITTEFPACRSGFKNQEVTPLKGGYFENGVGYECLTPDVLNLGVAPALLLERVSKRFQAIGGVIKEQTRLSGVCVSELVGSAIDLGEDQEPITARLVLDCMGNASPISAQQRYGKKADGICCVVGSCAGGFEAETNLYGDIIYTNQPIITRNEKGSNQYFWEAFPVGIGRGKAPGTSDVKTTYMFTYMDADEKRPALIDLFEDYWKLLPVYQPSIKNPETDLDIKRILFAYFPTYKDSPLKPEFSRVLAVGDASGIQSPLSFGGFGALTRHLSRVGGGISEALENDCLHKDDLARINDYQPNLSAAWMFQKAMSVKMGQKVDPKFVNRLLATNFEVMDDMGPRTMRPFLQDVVRFDGLLGSLARSFIADPTFMPQIVATVGVPELVKWLGHLGKMGQYSLLDSIASPFVKDVVDKYVTDPRERFKWKRAVESWKYGSGNDYKFPEEDKQ